MGMAMKRTDRKQRTPASIRPKFVVGVTSPYPTVVTVTVQIHIAVLKESTLSGCSTMYIKVEKLNTITDMRKSSNFNASPVVLSACETKLSLPNLRVSFSRRIVGTTPTKT